MIISRDGSMPHRLASPTVLWSSLLVCRDLLCILYGIVTEDWHCSSSAWWHSFLTIDAKTPERASHNNANGAWQPLLFSIGEQHCVLFGIVHVPLAETISFRSINDSHALANNFYRRRSSSLPILALLASWSMLLLLHAQEFSLEQHPARDNENRHRADNRNHAARSRLVARVEDAFLRDSQRCCGAARWVERFAVEEVADWFFGRFGCGFGGG